MKQITLRKWLQGSDAKAVAQAVGVDRSSVYHWRRGFSFPNNTQIQKLRLLSKKFISVDLSLDEFFARSNTKRWALNVKTSKQK